VPDALIESFYLAPRFLDRDVFRVMEPASSLNVIVTALLDDSAQLQA
jgi:hypothetical protein